MRISRLTTAVVLGSGLLLFLDLFLDWRQTTVNLTALSVETGRSGWGGWGLAAGIAVVALIVWEGARLQATQTPQQLLVAAVLGVLVAAFTLGAFFGGDGRRGRRGGLGRRSTTGPPGPVSCSP